MAERTDLVANIDESETYLEPVTDSADDEETDETQKIREQIEETRQEMSETIDALQEKLSLENISEQVSEQVSKQLSNVYQKTKETFYEATIGTAGKIMNTVSREMQNSNIINVARDNPIPLFLIALGAGMLIFKRNNRGSVNGRRRNYLSEGRRNVETQGGRSTLQKTRDTLTDTAASTYESTTRLAESAYQGTTRLAESAYQGVSNAVERTVDKVYDIGHEAQEQYDYYINEKPLTVGALALAAGVGIGMMLPTTRYEDDLMGDASRNLLTKAKDKTEETVKSLKNAAGQAVDVFRDEVQTQSHEPSPENK